MTSDTEARSAIFIEETYTYDIEIGSFSAVSCTATSGRVRVTVPYDGRLLANASAGELLTLGHLHLSAPTYPVSPATQLVQLPIDAHLQELLRSNREAVWDWEYTPPAPRDTLLAVEAAIVDGAALDPSMDDKQLYKLLFDNTDTFVNDLRLQLNLWVPRPNASILTGGRGRELRRLLLEQESDVQIFVAPGASETKLAESLAALANGAGGRILIGVHPSGDVAGVGEQMPAQEVGLLRAALSCSPPVAFAAPDMLESEDGLKVVRVLVPPSQAGPHLVEGKRPVRRGGKTVSEPAPASHRPAAPTQPIGDLRGLIANGPTADVILLGSKDTDVTEDDLGRAICALVNSEAGQGLVVVRYLRSPRGWLPWGGNQSATLSFEQRLDQAIRGLSPKLFHPRPEFATVDGEHITVLRIKGHGPTVAMFKGEAYEWNGAAISGIALDELYRRYIMRSGQQLHEGASSDPVTLVYGDLSWPLHPPSVLKLAADLQFQEHDHAFARFDDQWRAMVWRDRLFVDRKGTNGAVCSLTTRLRQAFTEIGGDPDSNPANELTGVLQIKLDNVLASGLECSIEAQHELLRGAPIYKRTHLVANLKLVANELFQRRRRASLLHFQVPDVGIGMEARERIADLQQVCADLGFWVDRPVLLPSSSDTRVLLRGVRSTNHHDIQLTLGLRYYTTDVARELHFEQRTDSRQIKTGQLDARVVLSGIGEGAGKAMAQLQLGLGQLIHERLHYLRTE